jgi:hypothetical protein
VPVVCDFTDNLIRDDRLPWPPPPVVQKLYASRQSRAFEGEELAAVDVDVADGRREQALEVPSMDARSRPSIELQDAARAFLEELQSAKAD